jgi:tetratricopeptide (TPR) repeat protein
MLGGHAAEAATAFAAASSRGSPKPDLLYNWAVALFTAGNAKRASEVLARIPEKDNSAQIQSLWGDIEEKNAHYAAALRHCQSAAQLDPSETNLYALGIELTRHWTFPAAIRIFEYGVAKHPESARLKLGLAVAKYGNDDYAGSALVLASLLEKEPENDLYADLLGRNCVLMGKGENSGCDKLERIAAQHPSNAAAALYVAEAILRQPQDEQNTTRARNLLEQAIAANPRLAEAFLQIGGLDQQEMRWQESAAMLEKAVALRPDYAQAHYRLARAYSHLGQREQAEKEIALQQEYSQKDENNRIARMREVTTFLVTVH